MSYFPLSIKDIPCFLRKEWRMGGRKEEVNVVFFIKMGIMPSYAICMKYLDLTFIFSAHAMFSRITQWTRWKEKLKWISKASEWCSDRGRWQRRCQTHYGSTQPPWGILCQTGKQRPCVTSWLFSESPWERHSTSARTWLSCCPEVWCQGGHRALGSVPPPLGLLLTSCTRLAVCPAETKDWITQI